MKASEYTFPLKSVTIRKKSVMIEALPSAITWLDIQTVAGKVVMAVRQHTGKDERLGEISIRPDGISFRGLEKAWEVSYART